MALVYLALDEKHGRPVAIKLLRPELAAGIGEARFLREIEIVARLSHPNLLPLYDSGTRDGFFYFVMPFVRGESLRDRLQRQQRIPWREVIDILHPVIEAIAYAHREGLVHRDLKPENILFQSEHPLVADFGIARAAGHEKEASGDTGITEPGMALGTPAYMSPEQAAGESTVDYRADLYSLGAIAYEMLTGCPPFVRPSSRRLIAAHISERPLSISELCPEVPSAFGELVMRCLEKDPAHRPQTAAALADELRSVSSSESAQSAARTAIVEHERALKRAGGVYALALLGVAGTAWSLTSQFALPEWFFSGALLMMAALLPILLFTGFVNRMGARTSSERSAPGRLTVLMLRARPHVTWRRAAYASVAAGGLFTASVGGFLSLRVLGVGAPGTLVAAGKFQPNDRVLVADFRVHGTDSTLGPVLAVAARAGLEQSEGINVVSAEAVRDALERMQRPVSLPVTVEVAREIALREGIKAVLEADLTASAGALLVELRLVSAASGNTLAAFSDDTDNPRTLIALVGKLSRRMRSKIGESLKQVRDTPPLERVTTSSLEALRKYTAGAYANDVEGDWPKAIELLQEAVAQDTGFAMAWRKLAAAHANNQSGRAPFDSAVSAAFRHRDRVTPLERDEITAYYYVAGPRRDRAKAARAYEALAQRDSNINLQNLGQIYWRRREFAKAEVLSKQIIARRPKSYVARVNLTEALCEQGKYEEASAALREMQRLFPEAPGNAIWQARLTYYGGDLLRYERTLDSLQQTERGPQLFLIFQAKIALTRGRLAEYQRLWEEARARGVLTPEQRLLGIVISARIESDIRRQPTTALNLLDRSAPTVAALPSVSRPYGAISVAFARAGRADKARAILRQQLTEMTDTVAIRINRPLIEYNLGEIAVAERQYSAALAHFRRADVLPDGPANQCSICLPLNLGRAFDAARQPDSAIVMFERYLNTPFTERAENEVLDPLYLAAIVERLGQLYEVRGDAAQATHYYRRFIDLWKHADAELQPRVAEARRRVAILN
jgi:tetratricopeptide (TPR) repeat protein